MTDQENISSYQKFQLSGFKLWGLNCNRQATSFPAPIVSFLYRDKYRRPDVRKIQHALGWVTGKLFLKIKTFSFMSKKLNQFLRDRYFSIEQLNIPCIN